MSRHNRRRTRGGRKAFTYCQHDALELPSSDTRFARRSDLSARYWHNRYLAWQAREEKQKEEPERLRAERKRIFGGDGTAGEDDGLCWRMMDYFVKLDYL